MTPLGLDVADFKSFLSNEVSSTASSDKAEKNIGYLARLASEKGLHHLVDGFIELKSRPNTEHIKLKSAGWLGPEHESYAQQQWDRLDAAGLSTQYKYLGALERTEKLNFFRQIDLLSVPTDFQEPKGIYVLESLAAGVPVVLPDHGAFGELIQQSGGGVLCRPRDPQGLADSLVQLLADNQQRLRLGQTGQAYVHEHRNADSMATVTSALIEKFLA